MTATVFPPKPGSQNASPEPEYVDELFPFEEEVPDDPWQDAGKPPAPVRAAPETTDEALTQEADPAEVPPEESASQPRPDDKKPPPRVRNPVPKLGSRKIKPRIGLPLGGALSPRARRWPVADEASSRRKPAPLSSNPPPLILHTPPVKNPSPASEPDKKAVQPHPTRGENAFQPLVDDRVEKPAARAEAHHPAGEPPPARGRIVLEELIMGGRVPQGAMVLGVCADGLPLVVDLADPSPGSILLIGEETALLQKHIKAILSSLTLLNPPEKLSVDIITPAVDQYAGEKTLPHLQNLLSPDQDAVFNLMGQLFEKVEAHQRKKHSFSGRLLAGLMPNHRELFHVLVIDQLDALVEQLASESLAYLRWLLRRGPAAQVWIVATLNARAAESLDRKTLNAFGLKTSGRLRPNAPLLRALDLPLNAVSTLRPGEQACAMMDGEVISFQIPEFGGR